MREEYLKILGVTKEASVDELKTAFRKKAKELHPDVNPAPNAKEQFILLTEAFEYLQHVKTERVYNESKKGYSQARRPYRNYAEWERFERHKARRRAEYHAKMNQKQYEESEHYNYKQLGNALADLMSFGFLIFIFLVVPIIGFSRGTKGIVGTVIIIFATVPVWAQLVLRDRQKFKLSEIKMTFKAIVESPIVHLALCIAINIFLLSFAFKTLMKLELMVIFYALPMAIVWLFSLRMKKTKLKRLVLFGAAPFLISCFFFVNYSFSSNPVSEKYSFKNVTQKNNRGGYQETTMINLKDDAYKEYVLIRVFFSYDEMKNANAIIYQF
ncbi:MAG: J domain-containing protein, partial [Bacteroidota bacterium]